MRSATLSELHRLDYDSQIDILYVHCGFLPDEKFKTNIVAGNLVLDLSTKGRVVGIELFDASDFLAEWGITKGMLEDLQNADLEAQARDTGMMVRLRLQFGDSRPDVSAMIAVPMEN